LKIASALAGGFVLQIASALAGGFVLQIASALAGGFVLQIASALAGGFVLKIVNIVAGKSFRKILTDAAGGFVLKTFEVVVVEADPGISEYPVDETFYPGVSLIGERGFVLETLRRVVSGGAVFGVSVVDRDSGPGRCVHRLEDVEFRGRAVFAVLEEISVRAVPGPVARRCVTVEPLALLAVIEGHSLRLQPGQLVVPDPMRFRQHP